MRVIRKANQRLTGTIARDQIVESTNKPVSCVGSQQQFLVIGLHQHMFYRRPRRQRQLTGERLALSACGRQGDWVNRVATPGGVNKDHRLIALPFYCGFKTVARFIVQPRRVDIVAFGAAHPAALRQNDGDRLGRQHIVLAHRFRFFTLAQRRTAIVAKGVGVGLQLFLQQVIHFAFRRQNGLQMVSLFFQLVLLTANLHLFQPGEMAQF